MEVGDRIKEIRALKGLSTYALAKKTGISQSTLSKLENGKRKANIDLLEKIAAALDVTVSRLTGESVNTMIEERLKEIGLSKLKVSKMANVSFDWLDNLDSFIPGEGEDLVESKELAWDDTIGDYKSYEWITRVANVIGLPAGKLREALARQEIPVYRGAINSASEDFSELLIPHAIDRLEKLGPASLPDGAIPYAPEPMISVPLVGAVNCGAPLLAEDNIEGFIPTPASDLQSGETYFWLRAKGDSMTNAGIHAGDFLLIRQQSDVDSGDIAVVAVNGDEATLKKVIKKENAIILQPENTAFETKVFVGSEMKDIHIRGRLMKLEKHF